MILVKSIWPLYGPIAGGTPVTIIGQSLDAVAAVYFGEYGENPDASRLRFSSLDSNGSCCGFYAAEGLK